MLHLLCEVQPAVVDVILGEGGHRFWSLPKRQIAIVGFTDHQVMQLLWRGVVVLNLEERKQHKQVIAVEELWFSPFLRLSSLKHYNSPTCRFSGPSMTLSPTTTFILGARLRTSGGWSLTGITVMLNFSITPLGGGATSNEDREAEEAEYVEERGEESEKKADEEGGEEESDEEIGRAHV